MKSWLLAIGAGIGLNLSADAAPLGIMVPAYFYPEPAGLWHSLSNSATHVPLIAILNPNSGPDTTQDPVYVAAVNALRGAGGQVIGYVSSVYTTRPIAEVKADIDRYLAFYSIDGFFIDEMTNDSNTNHLAYYTSVYQYIKAKNIHLSVTGNPGTNTEEEYLARPTTDRVVVFESNTGYATFQPDAWITNHLARQFVHLPYNVANSSTMSNDVSLAISRNAGWIYVTNDKGNNPWDTLPSYWIAEVALVESLNAATPVTRLDLKGLSNGIPSLQITGAPGTYELQATSNLSNWFPVQTLNAATNSVNVIDSSATNVPQRFYRTAQ